MYIHTSVFVSFETYPIFNMMSGNLCVISAKCHWIPRSSIICMAVSHVETTFWWQARLCGLPVQSPCSSTCFQAFYPAETSFYVVGESSRSLWSSPCCRIHRISTCNSNTGTKGQWFTDSLSISMSPVFPHTSQKL